MARAAVLHDAGTFFRTHDAVSADFGETDSGQLTIGSLVARATDGSLSVAERLQALRFLGSRFATLRSAEQIDFCRRFFVMDDVPLVQRAGFSLIAFVCGDRQTDPALTVAFMETVTYAPLAEAARPEFSAFAENMLVRHAVPRAIHTAVALAYFRFCERYGDADVSQALRTRLLQTNLELALDAGSGAHQHVYLQFALGAQNGMWGAQARALQAEHYRALIANVFAVLADEALSPPDWTRLLLALVRSQSVHDAESGLQLLPPERARAMQLIEAKITHVHFPAGFARELLLCTFMLAPKITSSTALYGLSSVGRLAVS